MPAQVLELAGALDPLRDHLRARAATDAHERAQHVLLEQKVAPWMGLPLWIPQENPEPRSMLTADCRRALEAGLTLRPPDETVRAIRAWDAGRGDPPLQAGLAPEREQEVLAAWRARGSTP